MAGENITPLYILRRQTNLLRPTMIYYLRFFLLACLFQGSMHATALQDEKFSEIFREHVSSFQNLDVAHSPFVIVFSATPGMGKSEVAKRLETSLKAVRLSSDTARRLLVKHGLKPNQVDAEKGQSILMCYMGYCVQQLLAASPNHLFILDMSIDREYPLLSSHATKNGWRIFVIQLAVSRTIAEERIRAREVDPEAYLKHMDRWFKDYNAFDQKNVNFVLNTSGKLEDLPMQELMLAITNSIEKK